MTPSDAERAIRAATVAGLSIGVAESLTGGAVCAELVSIPGASEAVRGGVVAYAADVKAGVLGVDQELLDRRGPVSAQTAVAMAAGVRAVLGADIGIATTGAAGPEPHGGKPPGTAFVAVDVGDGEPRVLELGLAGNREQICAGVRDAALRLAADTLDSLRENGDHGREQA